jgi:hypothetical protein
MFNRKVYVIACALLAASAALAFGGRAAADSAATGSQDTEIVSESAMLAGLGPGALFPFLDSTPSAITRTHIAVTDATAECRAGAAPPASVKVLVGEAGVALANVLTAATNTGIGTTAQCVFHVTARPGQGGVPATVTDVVVVNAGSAPLTGANTVTASASVRTAR